MLQILLVILLRQPHLDLVLFSLGILVIALLAMVPLRVSIRWLNTRTVVILALVGIFPQLVILATALHLLGWNGLWDRLI